MPPPIVMLDEMKALVRVAITDGGNVSVHCPSWRSLYRHLVCIGHSKTPLPDESVWKELDQWVASMLPKWKEHYSSIKTAKPQLPKGASFGPRLVRADTSSVSWEARIKVMPFVQLDALCSANKIKFDPNAPNPGIRTMRARNALYAALRRGVTLREPKAA